MDLIKIVVIIALVITGGVFLIGWGFVIIRLAFGKELLSLKEPSWITEWEEIDMNSYRINDQIYQRRQWMPTVTVGQFGHEVQYFHCPKAVPIVKIGERFITKDQLVWWIDKENIIVPIRVGTRAKINLNAEMIKKILLLI